jgi:hypothetical protein
MNRLIAAAAPDGQPISVVDPKGTYPEPAPMDCKARDVGGSSGDPAVNPLGEFDQVARRAFIGIAPEDQVVAVGYHGLPPSPHGWVDLRWQVLRDGFPVADLTFLIDPSGEERGVHGRVCNDSGITSVDQAPTEPAAHLLTGAGNPDAPLATQYEFPGYGTCSPYGDPTCTPVWMSWAKLASLSDQAIVQDGFSMKPDDTLPWCGSGGPEPQGCLVSPDDMPRAVFMPQTDADRWFADQGCGRSYDRMCRDPNVR